MRQFIAGYRYQWDSILSSRHSRTPCLSIPLKDWILRFWSRSKPNIVNDPHKAWWTLKRFYGWSRSQGASLYMYTCFHMMTSSNGSTFLVTGHLCGEFTGPRWIPRTKASDAELWCFLDLRPNKRLSKQPWFETPPCPLWRHCNGLLRHW